MDKPAAMRIAHAFENEDEFYDIFPNGVIFIEDNVRYEYHPDLHNGTGYVDRASPSINPHDAFWYRRTT